jgi:fido (protein-threonine AMPylation protein)
MTSDKKLAPSAWDFGEYLRQGEPDKKERAQNWRIAIGLQQVDGLTPSAYLIETARQNIEGEITIGEVKNRIDAYYKQQAKRNQNDSDRTQEADTVSSRITEILNEKTFSFSPLEYINIHRRLFVGIYKFAGKIRDYNITKAEWVLDGATVFYSDCKLIGATLEYDFAQEKKFEYKGLTKQEQAEHIARFISGLWQIHAFGEGNTRTTAVFAIKYLCNFGFDLDNEPFAEHSWYFRNSLVRANYNDLQNDIHATPKYLMRFFGNFLFGEGNDLKNREMHVKYGEYLRQQQEKFPVKTGGAVEKFPVTGKKFLVNGKKLPITGLEIIKLIQNDRNITILDLAEQLHISDRAVKNNLNKLRENGILTRVGSDKTGHWKITGKGGNDD